MEHLNLYEEDLPELPGCPVVAAWGITEIDAQDRAAAHQLLEAHLADTTRTCCDSEGFAILPVILVKPTPIGIGYYAYLPGHEEPYGSIPAKTPELAYAWMQEHITEHLIERAAKFKPVPAMQPPLLPALEKKPAVMQISPICRDEVA